MYIKKLQLLNFQVIEKFEAEFDGTVYFVTGDNELGKSTLLKAIGALLTGERDDVLRNGASKGFAKMIVGDDGEEFDVSLSFTEANPRGTLTIKQKTTGMQTNNVSMLGRIFGYQDFDAVEFSRWSETAEGRRKQIAVVKALLPESVRNRIDEIDAKVAELKTERADLSRDVKAFDGYVKTLASKLEPGDEERYGERIDISGLMERQQKNAALIEKAKSVRGLLVQRIKQLADIPTRIDAENESYDAAIIKVEEMISDAKFAYEQAIAQAEKMRASAIECHNKALAQIEAERADFENRKTNAEEWLAKYEENNPEKTNVSDLLAQADAHNKRNDLVCQYREKKMQLSGATMCVEKLNTEIAELGTERAGLIANAKLPIDGLTFTDDGLELNGVPFIPGRVSDSQTMEIAAKLVIASNPTVKVFRIARGESLGAKRLQTIVDIAKRNGFQGFIEQVQRGQTEMQVEEYVEK